MGLPGNKSDDQIDSDSKMSEQHGGRSAGEVSPSLGETIDAVPDLGATVGHDQPPTPDLGETIDSVPDLGATVDQDPQAQDPAVNPGPATDASIVAGAPSSTPTRLFPGSDPAALRSVLHFDIERELGRGAMGIVYLARDTRLGRRVAVKALGAEITSDPERVERLQREARILARVNHPNIGAIHSLEIVGDRMFLILELVDGGELSDRIAAGMAFVDVWDLGGQMASALAFAHGQSIVHRDLKPANVMVTSEGQIKVLDFGMACTLQTDDDDPLLGSEVRPGVLAGTPIYMSPEQFEGRGVDRRSDVWAFGCVLYECLTQSVPFQAATLKALARQVAFEEPDWSRLPTETPSAVQELIRSCLVKDRDQRLDHLQSATQVLKNLKPRTIAVGSPALVSRAQLQPLDRVIHRGESLLLRAVVSNASAGSMEGRVELRGSDQHWELDHRSRAAFQSTGGASVRLLLYAKSIATGDVPSPELEVTFADAGQSRWVVSNRPFITVHGEPIPPVVGQSRAQEKIRQWLDEPASQAGRLLLLSGETGSGRSDTLAWAAEEARTRGVRGLRGFAPAGSPAGQPLLNDLQRDLLCIVDAEHTDASLKKSIEEAMAEYLGGDSPTGESLVSSLLNDEKVTMTEEARMYRWYRLFAAASLESPLVFLLKDLHNADQETLSILQGVLARCHEEDFPVMAVATRLPSAIGAKDPLRDLIESDVCAGQLEFENLEATHVEELLDFYYPQSHFRDEFPALAETVVRKTAGQPAFVREIVIELGNGPVDSRLFVRSEDGTWRTCPVEHYTQLVEDLPVRYADILDSKIQRLPAECREPLELAALIGFEFPIEVLEELVPDADALDDALDGLEVANLIAAQDSDLKWYRFTSSLVPGLVREALATGGSRKAARKRAKVANAVVDVFGENATRAEWLGLLLLDLGRSADARPYLLQGLRQRMDRGQFADAGTLIDRIDAVEHDPDAEPEDEAARVEWTLVKTRALSALGRPEAALACAQSVAALTASRDHAVQRSELLLVQAEIEIRRGNFDAAVGPVEAVVGSSEELPAAVRALALFDLAAVRRFQGRREEATTLLRQSLEVEIPEHTTRQDLERQARGRNNLGVFLFEMGQLEEAERCFADTAKIAKEIQNYDFQATAAVWLANLHFLGGRLQIARSSYLDAMEIFRRLGKKQGLQNSYYNIGQVERLLGRRDAARQYLQRAVELSGVTMDQRSEVRNRIELAGAFVDERKLDLAAAEAHRVSEFASSLRDPSVEVFAIALRAIVAAEGGATFDDEIIETERVATHGPDAEAASLIAQCLRARGSASTREGKLGEQVGATLGRLVGVETYLLRFELLLAAGADAAELAQTPWGTESAEAVLRARVERIGDSTLREQFARAIDERFSDLGASSSRAPSSAGCGTKEPPQ